MLGNQLKNLLNFDHEKRFIIFAERLICETTSLKKLLMNNGFMIYEYRNVESFRIIYEEQLKRSDEKTAVIVSSDIYVPYDIRRSFKEVAISTAALFPNLDADTVLRYLHDWDIIGFAAAFSYSDFSSAAKTEEYISNVVFSADMIERFCKAAAKRLKTDCETAASYQDWINIAKNKASIEYYMAMKKAAVPPTKRADSPAAKEIGIDLDFIDDAFNGFIADGYGRLSSEVNRESPTILTKALSVIMADRNAKSALIVMDGMSLFDFKAISRYFEDMQFDYSCTFALIPTTTPISRQSLLSGKYPRELPKPFSLANEEKEFKSGAASFGLAPAQADYLRGYDAQISPSSKLAAIVINEVDDIAHGQRQGRMGMFNDMDLLGRSGKVQSLIRRLYALGFAVYITSDHGNAKCAGAGGFRSGVEMESRSSRMAVLKDEAFANALLIENTTEYQGFYLDKSYRYFLCESGVSFDAKGADAMTHGGMSIDEVIVPFIRIRGIR